MKRIKKLNLITITSGELHNINGGATCDYSGSNVASSSCDYSTSDVSGCAYNGSSFGDGGGSGRYTECGGDCICMPGDRADTASFIGSQLANNFL